MPSRRSFDDPNAPSGVANTDQQNADFATEQGLYATKIKGVQSLADTAKDRYSQLQSQNKEGLAAYGANTQQGLYEGRRNAANALAAQQGAIGSQGGRGGYAALLGTGIASGQQAQDYTAKRGEGYQQLAEQMSANEYSQNIAAQKAQDQVTDVTQNLGTESQRRETKWQTVLSQINDARTNRTGTFTDDLDAFVKDLLDLAQQQTDPILKQRLLDKAKTATQQKSIKV